MHSPACVEAYEFCLTHRQHAAKNGQSILPRAASMVSRRSLLQSGLAVLRNHKGLVEASFRETCSRDCRTLHHTQE